MSTNPSPPGQKFFPKTEERRWLSGFLLLGSLLGSVASFPIVWDYHFEAGPQLVQLNFLGLNAGAMAGTAVAHALGRTASARVTGLLGCLTSVAAWLTLWMTAPPARPVFRVLGLGSIGFAAGIVAASLLAAIDEICLGTVVAVAAHAGALFGCGAFFATAVFALSSGAGAEEIGSLVLGAFSLFYVILFGFTRSPAARRPPTIREQDRRLAVNARRSRALGTVLFSALIFVQFGMEWAVAGWLALFFIRRFGVNPVWGIWTVGIYFFLLTFARLLSRRMLPWTGHRKMLWASVAAAVTGCIILASASSPVPGWVAICLVAIGFASVYPLLSNGANELLGYTAGFYNGMFAIALTGAMTTSCLLGLVENAFGMRFVMLVPAAGSIAVLGFALLSELEARLMGQEPAASPRTTRASGK